MLPDEYYLKRALTLARRGRGKTSPNPMVGAVIVRNDRIVGEGFHLKAGLRHAEIAALKKAGNRARGAVLYVNLEPCRHYGRTPPCVDAIIKSGVKRVVAAMVDPNPVNRGKGISRLRKAGIKVETGLLEKEARALNEAFIKYVGSGIPFVTAKTAQSLDGKIATVTGDSKWVTGERSRRFVHRLRAEADAVLTGINTVIRDDPLLNARAGSGPAARQPLRVVIDSTLRIPPDAKLLKDRTGGKVLIAVSRPKSVRKAEMLRKKGAEIVRIPGRKGRVDLKKLLRRLAERGVTRVLIEGGGEITASALEERLVDRMCFFIAPKIVGGKSAVTPVEGGGIGKMNRAIELTEMRVRRFGTDLMVEGRPEYPGGG
jgi:diaminohydroxyphosphoribosylaminopyrimidine deaminase/5-amino-6-(5-phosphoribosylamino)uracil reductase